MSLNTFERSDLRLKYDIINNWSKKSKKNMDQRSETFTVYIYKKKFWNSYNLYI